MQWRGGKNLGFSSADRPYLPVDPAPDAPTVVSEEENPVSLLNTLKNILTLRHNHEALNAQPNLEILYARKGGLPFIYKRGSLIMAVNPSGERTEAPLGLRGDPVYAIGGGRLEKGRCLMEQQSFAVFKAD
jgi:maltose alpha-D-glucosyltransferase/alpha-amylase